MSEVVRFSEAAALALHAMAVLAQADGRRVRLHELATTLLVSESHLAKVLQRLARRGLVISSRGPGGGFRLGRDGREIALLEVYEAIEGPYRIQSCMFSTPRCEGGCLVGDLLATTNRMVRDHLAQARLSELSTRFGSTHEAKNSTD